MPERETERGGETCIHIYIYVQTLGVCEVGDLHVSVHVVEESDGLAAGA